jgi:DNA replication protein DnaC
LEKFLFELPEFDITPDHQAKVAEFNRKREQSILKVAMESFPKRFFEIKDYVFTQSYNEAKRAMWGVLQGQKVIVYHFGEKGTGKTITASQICKEIILSEKMPCLPICGATYISALELAEAPYGKGDNDYDIMAYRARMGGILVLDDLGQEGKNKDRLEALICNIYDGSKKTIITSNILIENLHYSSRVVDRLNEIAIPIKMNQTMRKGIKK